MPQQHHGLLCRRAALGFACLAFNRRGQDILSIRDSRAVEGAALQTFAEGRGTELILLPGW